MGVFDFKAFEKLIENNVNEQNIGFNKKQIIINATDKSTNITLNLTINVNLSPDEASKLSPQKVAKLVKDSAMGTVRRVITEKAPEMAKVIAAHTPMAISTATSGIAASHIQELLKPGAVPAIVEGYIEALPETMKAIVFHEGQFIDLGDTQGVAAEWEKQDDYK